MTVHIRPLIRPLTAKDSSDAAQIFFDAIHLGTADVYTEEHRLAWAGGKPNQAGWHKRFINLDGYVAEVSGQMVGFMTIDETGYIDLAFVAPEAIGNGIGRKLYDAVETRALDYKAKLLTTQASKKAKPFFERMGWTVECEQVVVKGNVELTNYKMFKVLSLER